MNACDRDRTGRIWKKRKRERERERASIEHKSCKRVKRREKRSLLCLKRAQRKRTESGKLRKLPKEREIERDGKILSKCPFKCVYRLTGDVFRRPHCSTDYRAPHLSPLLGGSGINEAGKWPDVVVRWSLTVSVRVMREESHQPTSELTKQLGEGPSEFSPAARLRIRSPPLGALSRSGYIHL